jgi:hypothetical protein
LLCCMAIHQPLGFVLNLIELDFSPEIFRTIEQIRQCTINTTLLKLHLPMFYPDNTYGFHANSYHQMHFTP